MEKTIFNVGTGDGMGKSSVKGTPGVKLIRFAGSIPADDLRLMRDAIQQDCEKIDADGW